MKALSRMTAAIARIDLALDGLVLKLQIRAREPASIVFLICRGRKPARRIAGIGAGGGDVLGHDRARPDHDVIGDAHRHDGGVGADRNPVADHGLAPQFLVAARPGRRSRRYR